MLMDRTNYPQNAKGLHAYCAIYRNRISDIPLYLSGAHMKSQTLEHFQWSRPGIDTPTATPVNIGFAIAMGTELGVCE
jgi:hypothetical protein